MPSEWKLNYVHCGGLPIHFECICSGAVTAADQNSTWFLALGVAELPHDEDLDDDDHDHGAELPQVKDLDDDDIIKMLVMLYFFGENTVRIVKQKRPPLISDHKIMGWLSKV